MVDNYINNFESIVSSIFFMSFKIILIALVILLVLSLIMLAVGCLIKSQKIKSKFLVAVPSLLILNIFFIAIPYTFVLFKNMN